MSETNRPQTLNGQPGEDFPVGHSKYRSAGTWKPGQSGNPSGRPKGSLNHAQADIMQGWADFVAGNVDKLHEAMEAMPPEKRGMFLLEVSKYIAPMVSRSQVDVTSLGRSITGIDLVRHVGVITQGPALAEGHLEELTNIEDITNITDSEYVPA